MISCLIGRNRTSACVHCVSKLRLGYPKIEAQVLYFFSKQIFCHSEIANSEFVNMIVKNHFGSVATLTQDRQKSNKTK